MDANRYSAEGLRNFALAVLKKADVDPHEAKIIADVFVWFDLVGRYSQGLWRLPVYLKKVQAKLILSPCEPLFEQKGPSLYLLRGNNGFGHYLGHHAMHKAIQTAREYGVGIVTVSDSNHFGANAYYLNQAALEGMIGIALSNSVPHVAAFGGIKPVLGTNPFGFSAPLPGQKPLLVDFSTGASAGSKIMKAVEQNARIPEGYLIDEEGNSVTDPSKAGHSTMLPFGGAKGYGLGLMIEILSGVITGAAISHQIASLHKNFERHSNIGHFFMALDIEHFMPRDMYSERMQLLIDYLKASSGQVENREVLIPGERRWKHYESQLEGGIVVDNRTQKNLEQMASQYRVELPAPVT